MTDNVLSIETQALIDKIFADVDCYIQNNDTGKPLFFDTENTGNSKDDQIIEIAFCDSDRNVIVDTLIYTGKLSKAGALKVYGIYAEELIGKPRFIDIQPAIFSLLQGCTFYAYNASFDIRMMRQSAHKLRLQQVEVICLTKQYANFIGQYYTYFGNNRYFSLKKAFAYIWHRTQKCLLS